MTPEKLAELREFVASLDGLTSLEGLALIDHIDAMVAREAKLRALHRKLHHESGLGPMCTECVEDWPCNTIRILDGD